MAVVVNFTFVMASLFRGEHPEWFEHNYIFFLMTYLLVFGRLSKALMLNHCCNQNYSMIQLPALILCLVLNCYTFVVNFYPESCSSFGVNVFWLMMFGGWFIYYLMYVGSLLKVLSNSLGIEILTIKDRPIPWQFPLSKKFL